MSDELYKAASDALATPGPCWCAAIAADGAKALRQEHGDVVADRLTARLAEALRAAASPGEAVGRLGPDTLGVLVSGPRASKAETLLAVFHGAAARASRLPVSAGAATGDPSTIIDRAKAALAAARGSGGARALLEGGHARPQGPAGAVAGDSLATRFQRLVLLNRLAMTLFSLKSSTGGLAAAFPYILALSGAKGISVHGPHVQLASPGTQVLEEDPSFKDALQAARATAAASWQSGAPYGWYAIPFAVSGESPDGALMLAFAPENQPGVDLAPILAEVALFLQAALRAQEMHRLKDEFVALVTHDLRTPLTSIRGFADTLMNFSDRIDTAERRRFASIILREAKRMSRMVDDFLDLSRLETGTVPLRREPVDLRAVAERVLETLHGYGPAVGFELDFPAGLPSPLADAEQLERVLTNLGSNAVKYTPAKGTVRLQARRIHGAVEVGVLDQGPGVPVEARAHLFEKFYRASDAVAASIKGSGLGLAAAKAIIGAHGGSIRYEDAPGGGSAFIFTLPVE